MVSGAVVCKLLFFRRANLDRPFVNGMACTDLVFDETLARRAPVRAA
jgi:hypothetical protein